MSNPRQIGNNRFRNPKARKPLPLADFLELLAGLFPDRELIAKSVVLPEGEIAKGCVLVGSKAEDDFKWAGEFHRATSEAFSSAVTWELLKKRQADELVADRLSKIANSASKLAELITGVKDCDYNDEASRSSHQIWYWMTYAIDRDPNDFERFVEAIPEIARAARMGREALEADVRNEQRKEGKKSLTEAGAPNVMGRPKGTGDIFKDRFVQEMKPVWGKFAPHRPATLHTDYITDQPCPFCEFCAEYLDDGDTADGLAMRYRRATADRA
jgi:hypothetical protein